MRPLAASDSESARAPHEADEGSAFFSAAQRAHAAMLARRAWPILHAVQCSAAPARAGARGLYGAHPLGWSDGSVGGGGGGGERPWGLPLRATTILSVRRRGRVAGACAAA